MRDKYCEVYLLLEIVILIPYILIIDMLFSKSYEEGRKMYFMWKRPA